MDTQRKKGVLDICVLSVLQKGPSYGYVIIDEVSKCVEISESTLYPLLKRLESLGCVTGYTPVSYTHLDVYKRQAQRDRHYGKSIL